MEPRGTVEATVTVDVFELVGKLELADRRTLLLQLMADLIIDSDVTVTQDELVAIQAVADACNRHTLHRFTFYNIGLPIEVGKLLFP